MILFVAVSDFKLDFKKKILYLKKSFLKIGHRRH